jgi:hypothetical protein
MTATISKNSINELLSGSTVNKSYDKQAHIQAVVNIDKLFVNAIEPWKFALNPHKNNDSLIDVRRFYAPMEYGERIIPIKITIKEMKNPKDGNRLYSVEALDVDLDKKIEDAGYLARGSNSPPISPNTSS